MGKVAPKGIEVRALADVVRQSASAILSAAVIGLFLSYYALAGQVHDNSRDLASTSTMAKDAALAAAAAASRLERVEEKIDGLGARMTTAERDNETVQRSLNTILQEIGKLQGAQRRQ